MNFSVNRQNDIPERDKLSVLKFSIIDVVQLGLPQSFSRKD